MQNVWSFKTSKVHTNRGKVTAPYFVKLHVITGTASVKIFLRWDASLLFQCKSVLLQNTIETCLQHLERHITLEARREPCLDPPKLMVLQRSSQLIFPFNKWVKMLNIHFFLYQNLGKNIAGKKKRIWSRLIKIPKILKRFLSELIQCSAKSRLSAFK